MEEEEEEEDRLREFLGILSPLFFLFLFFFQANDNFERVELRLYLGVEKLD